MAVTVTPLTRSLLSHRSVEDKIAFAIDVGGPPGAKAEEINRLVAEGVLVWIDRTRLGHIGVLSADGLRAGPLVDVYQLTPLGIALCNELGIKQR
jgi:hypothetical protein